MQPQPSDTSRKRTWAEGPSVGEQLDHIPRAGKAACAPLGRVTSWDCPACTLNNDGGAICAMCEGPFGTQIEDVGSDTSWDCSACTFHNDGGATCAMCGRPLEVQIEEVKERSKTEAYERWPKCWICGTRIALGCEIRLRAELECPHVSCPAFECRSSLHQRWLDKRRELLELESLP